MMERVAFKMKLKEGYGAEYQKRHNAIWPELKSLLCGSGIEEYYIFMDGKTNVLFGLIKVVNAGSLTSLRDHEVMKKWWAYMKDIMETNDDNSPLRTELKEVFSLF